MIFRIKDGVSDHLLIFFLK